MKLIRELNQEVESQIVEAADGTKDLYISGIFMQTEAKNKNGRVYPRQMMEHKVQQYVTDYVQKNRAMGEMEHPPTPQINLDRVSHLITELNFQGNDIYGKAKVLDTPCGKIVRGLIEGGVQLGVSSRGLGSVQQKNGINEVQNDFRLVTVDVVSDPSAHDAMIQGIMEGAEWVWESGAWKENEIDSVQHEFRQKYNEERALRLMEQFFKSMRN